MSARFLSAVFVLAVLAGTPPLLAASSLNAQDDSRVDMLLCLAADASESVNEFEYELQRIGHAAAIEDPGVVRAIRDGHRGRIAVAYVEWARPDQQFLGMGWRVITDADSASSVAREIREAPPPPWIKFNVRDTSTGDAIRFCLEQFRTAPVDADRHVIDISSNGTSNSGVRIAKARDYAVDQGAVINVLAIERPVSAAHALDHMRPHGGLARYFLDNVVGGHGAFVRTANGYGSFAEMMKRKFLTEIALSSPHRAR